MLGGEEKKSVRFLGLRVGQPKPDSLHAGQLPRWAAPTLDQPLAGAFRTQDHAHAGPIPTQDPSTQTVIAQDHPSPGKKETKTNQLILGRNCTKRMLDLCCVFFFPVFVFPFLYFHFLQFVRFFRLFFPFFVFLSFFPFFFIIRHVRQPGPHDLLHCVIGHLGGWDISSDVTCQP